ncbi:MAG: chromosome segregation protein SMC [Candidatus Lernaella stagnicola]|nr:chromosome segregation protein SMC [Candidatus Lernaella stagnicola]
MRIKEIELVGFKSFVDKTKMTFDEGISGVVGPNGCGKSNIVDAIRWCMGEMSAKSLRGSEMQDVIFNGTESRKPMGMAQASILFSCEDGVYPSGYEGMTEIQVTRRLYRSGESEYLINRRPCRLKDVIDLFLDTGIGSRAYSIIEQGQISRIIAAKPLDRRVLIEEAAGISKYRVKREEAERKIEATRTNLNRVNDLLFEIKRTLNSLQRQAGKARRYHEFKAELRELDVELAAREKRHLGNESERVRTDLARLRDLRAEAAVQLEADETRLAALRLDVLEQEKAINTAVEKVGGIRENVRADESRREILAHDIQTLEEQIGAWQEDVENARGRIEEMDQQVAAAVTEMEQLDEQILAAEAVLGEHQARLEAALLRRAELDKTAEAARNELLGLAGRKASLERAVQNHAENVTARHERLEQTRTRLADTDSALVASVSDKEKLHEEIERLTTERRHLEQNLGEKTARLAELKSNTDGRRHALDESRAAFQKKKVRLESLQEMARNLEGYQFGVRRILEAARSDSGALNGSSKSILGVLADKIEINEKFETALEAVLGERLQAVLVTDQETGAVAADFLKTEHAGRSSFVPVAPRLIEAHYPAATAGQTLGPLTEHVSVASEFEDAAHALLDNVLVVDNLETALRLHKANGYTGAFVTLDGEVVDPSGAITGGQVDAVTSGLLQKKREIAALSEGMGDEEGAVKKAEDEYYKAEGMIARLQDVVAQVRKELDENHIALSENRGELGRLDREIERLNTENARLAQAAHRITEELDESARRHEAEGTDLAQIEHTLAAARHATDEKTAAQQALTAEIDGIQNAVREAMLRANELRQAKNAAMSRRDNFQRAKQEAQTLVARRGEQSEEARTRQNAHREQIGVLTSGLSEKLDTLEQAERAAVEVREGVDEKVTTVERAEAALKMLRRDIEGYEKEIHSSDLSASEIKMKFEHLAERLMEKYEMALEDIPEPADEAEIDTEALRTRAREISQKISQMGEVNPNAVEEFAEQKERYDHYEAQKLDLDNAIEELRRAIAKINKTSKERFEQTFNLVNHKFGEVMPVLFGGGMARLVLTEPDKPLETGIDIVIRPPGKRLTNVTLLSGGEKALASIGLIFSIFLVKPSPFCLLDEVDAPLDDANIYRFNKLVNEMAAHSQIILITHNKSTMEVADRLFGVTMQEKGVSRMVSVEMVKDELD